MISEARSILGVYDRAEMMIQSGLYTDGADPRIDEAIIKQPLLEQFMTRKGGASAATSFAALKRALSGQ
jgi:flagellum-specific ATP synthase